MEATLPLGELPIGLTLILIVLCIMAQAFFSSSEAALISVSRFKIRYLAEKGVKAAISVEKLRENYSKLFSTILATENMFIILATSLGTALGIYLFKEEGVLLATLVMTLLVVIFGEVTPKTYAAGNAEQVSLLVARPMQLIVKILSPLIMFLTFFAGLLLKLLKTPPKALKSFTPEEFKAMLMMGEKEEILPKDERELIKGVFAFGDILAKEIMIPRVEMVCFPEELGEKEMVKLILKTGHSRFPVYQGDLDHINGIVYAKDLLKAILTEKEFTARELMRPIHFAPGNQKILKLLADLKNKQNSLAIILDEFGGTAGLITIETLLEEIVGEIEDEYDLNLPEIQELKPGVFLVNARFELEELEEKFKVNFPEEEYRSIGGFLVSRLGRIPLKGEKLEHQGLLLEVEEMDRYKLKRIKITKKEEKA